MKSGVTRYESGAEGIKPGGGHKQSQGKVHEPSLSQKGASVSLGATQGIEGRSTTCTRQ